MLNYEPLSHSDYVLIIALTIVVVTWQLSIGDSFTSRITSAILIGGLSLAIGTRLVRWYRKR
jgi:hypothetical protein